MAKRWVRIPCPIKDERDRRDICAALCVNNMETRIVKVRLTDRGTPKFFIECRDCTAAKKTNE